MQLLRRLFNRLFVCSRQDHVSGIRMSMNCLRCGGFVHERKWKDEMA